jgi:hypothetical protein
MSIDLFDMGICDSVELTTPLFWRVITISSHWQVLDENVIIIVSFPPAEADNERPFAIRKDVIGECRARLKAI